MRLTPRGSAQAQTVCHVRGCFTNPPQWREHGDDLRVRPERGTAMERETRRTDWVEVLLTTGMFQWW